MLRILLAAPTSHGIRVQPLSHCPRYDISHAPALWHEFSLSASALRVGPVPGAVNLDPFRSRSYNGPFAHKLLQKESDVEVILDTGCARPMASLNAIRSLEKAYVYLGIIDAPFRKLESGCRFPFAGGSSQPASHSVLIPYCIRGVSGVIRVHVTDPPGNNTPVLLGTPQVRALALGIDVIASRGIIDVGGTSYRCPPAGHILLLSSMGLGPSAQTLARLGFRKIVSATFRANMLP